MTTSTRSLYAALETLQTQPGVESSRVPIVSSTTVIAYESKEPRVPSTGSHKGGEDRGVGGGSRDGRPPSKPSKLSVATPPDQSASDGNLLQFDLTRIKDSQLPDPEFVDYASLQIDSDLAELIKVDAIRKRYREGRYVPGKNISIRIPAYPSAVSHSAGSIGHYARIDGGVGLGTITSLAMHIGCLEMLKWESINKLAAITEEFHREQPNLSRLSQSITSNYLRNSPMLELPRGDRTFTIPMFVSDALTDLTCKGFYGLPPATVGSYAIMLVFANQSKKYVNKSDAVQMREWVAELKTTLELKAESLSALGEKIKGKEEIEI